MLWSQSHVYSDTSGDLKELRTEVWESVLSPGLMESSLALSECPKYRGAGREAFYGKLGTALYDEGLLPIRLTQVNQAQWYQSLQFYPKYLRKGQH